MDTYICIDMQKYRVVFGAGKPYEEFFVGETALKQGLKDFYTQNLKDNEDNYPFDAIIYTIDTEGEEINISESQFINELIGEILMEEELREEKSLD